MRTVAGILAALACLSAPAALAHTTVSVGPYDIEVGWGLEPPVVSVRNTFVFHVTEPGDNPGVKTGIINAFRDLEATANYGGVTKTLEINSDARPGFYYADVIPTRTGSFSVTIQGTLVDTPVDVVVPIEDAESTALLDFPPTSGSSSSEDLEALEAAIKSMQAELASMQTPSGTSDRVSGGAAYDFAILGVSLGVAAVALAILALVRRPG